jgi:hypothetical protein
LERNPYNDGATRGGGTRIFPDKVSPTDGWAAHRKKIRIVVLVQGFPRGDVPIYVWAYDVDDPSSNQPPLDIEGNPNPANPADKGKPADNREPFDASDPNAERRWMELANPKNTDRTGLLRLECDVSMRPGDNYRFIASLTGAAQNGFYPKQDDPAMRGSVYGPDDKPVKDRPDLQVSELVTVWRRLHVERDHMGKPRAGDVFAGIGVQQVENTFTEGGDDAKQQDPVRGPGIDLMITNHRPAYIEVKVELQHLNKIPELRFEHNFNAGCAGWHGLAAQDSQNAQPVVVPGGQPVAPNRIVTT